MVTAWNHRVALVHAATGRCTAVAWCTRADTTSGKADCRSQPIKLHVRPTARAAVHALRVADASRTHASTAARRAQTPRLQRRSRTACNANRSAALTIAVLSGCAGAGAAGCEQCCRRAASRHWAVGCAQCATDTLTKWKLSDASGSFERKAGTTLPRTGEDLPEVDVVRHGPLGVAAALTGSASVRPKCLADRTHRVLRADLCCSRVRAIDRRIDRRRKRYMSGGGCNRQRMGNC